MTETIGVSVSTASAVLVVAGKSAIAVSAVEESPVVAMAVSVGGEELRDSRTDEEMAGASVTGHTVVVTPITVVTKTVDTPSGKEVGSEVTAPVPEIAGQLVTVGAHETIVSIEVAETVSVVNSTPTAVVEVFANGGMAELEYRMTKSRSLATLPSVTALATEEVVVLTTVEDEIRETLVPLGRADVSANPTVVGMELDVEASKPFEAVSSAAVDELVNENCLGS
ncbi:hypothetical protein ANO14919_056940 [Xylariales sp. No.14919]|nr:hypothetical protein ANO14919_056940 [Xylariales sp. No.14919]